MKTYLRLIKYIKPHLHVLISAVAAMLVSSFSNNFSIWAMIPFISIIFANQPVALGDAPPEFIRKLIEYINQVPKDQLLVILVIVIVIVAIVRAVSLYLQSYLMNKVSYRTVRDIRNNLYQKMIDLPVSFFKKSHTGGLVSRVSYDTTVVRDCISEGVTDLVFQSSQVIMAIAGIFIAMRSFNIPREMLIVTCLLLPAVMYPVAKMGKKLKQISKDSQIAMEDFHTALHESVQGVHIVKAFGMEDYERNRFKSINQRFYRLVMKSQKRITLVSPLTECVGALCAAFIVAVGGHKVIGGKLNPAVLVGFLTSLLFMLKPFKRLARVHLINQQALAAAKRIFKLMDEDKSIQENQGAINLKPIEQNIQFKDVCFSYNDANGTDEIFKNINLDVKKGEIIAIVGPSGAGKTTLVNLIPRFYDPTKGIISIDGIDLRDVTVASLRDQIGIVSQETFLFHDTVKNNIAYGTTDMPFEKIKQAAKLANAHDFIMEMPNAYDTVIGERGAKISGGQKQRLAIARALLKNPPILILDEATSQLDTESEKQVQQAIDRLIENRTVFVIAHRLSTVQHASRIIVLDQGRILEQGRHDQLYSQSGLYKKLYDMQFTC